VWLLCRDRITRRRHRRDTTRPRNPRRSWTSATWWTISRQSSSAPPNHRRPPSAERRQVRFAIGNVTLVIALLTCSLRQRMLAEKQYFSTTTPSIYFQSNFAPRGITENSSEELVDLLRKIRIAIPAREDKNTRARNYQPWWASEMRHRQFHAHWISSRWIRPQPSWTSPWPDDLLCEPREKQALPRLRDRSEVATAPERINYFIMRSARYTVARLAALNRWASRRNEERSKSDSDCLINKRNLSVSEMMIERHLADRKCQSAAIIS